MDQILDDSKSFLFLWLGQESDEIYEYDIKDIHQKMNPPHFSLFQLLEEYLRYIMQKWEPIQAQRQRIIH